MTTHDFTKPAAVSANDPDLGVPPRYTREELVKMPLEQFANAAAAAAVASLNATVLQHYPPGADDDDATG